MYKFLNINWFFYKNLIDSNIMYKQIYKQQKREKKNLKPMTFLLFMGCSVKRYGKELLPVFVPQSIPQLFISKK